MDDVGSDAAYEKIAWKAIHTVAQRLSACPNQTEPRSWFEDKPMTVVIASDSTIHEISHVDSSAIIIHNSQPISKMH